MSTSVNGWPGIPDENDSRLAWGTVPGTKKKVLLRKEVLPVFLAFLSEVNKTLILLDPGPLDGWEYRETRTGQGLSAHASGTACDFRYDVLLADNELHWPPTKHAQMHKLLDKYVTSDGRRVFGWGGDWTPGKYADEMHLESIQSWSPGSGGQNAVAADFADVQKRLRIKNDGTFSILNVIVPPKKPTPNPNPPTPAPTPAPQPKSGPAPTPAPTPAPKPAPVKTKSKVSLASVQPGKKNQQIATVQDALNKEFGAGLTVDGGFGPLTKAAYANWQKACGYKGANADGVPGIKTLTALGDKYGFAVTE